MPAIIGIREIHLAMQISAENQAFCPELIFYLSIQQALNMQVSVA